MKLLFFFVAFSQIIPGHGQMPEVFQKMKAIYPDELGVFLERNKTVTLLVKDDSISATAYVEETILYLKDEANKSAVSHVYGSHFVEIEGLESKMFVWEKNRYEGLRKTGFIKNHEEENSIFLNPS